LSFIPTPVRLAPAARRWLCHGTVLFVTRSERRSTAKPGAADLRNVGPEYRGRRRDVAPRQRWASWCSPGTRARGRSHAARQAVAVMRRLLMRNRRRGRPLLPSQRDSAAERRGNQPLAPPGVAFPIYVRSMSALRSAQLPLLAPRAGKRPHREQRVRRSLDALYRKAGRPLGHSPTAGLPLYAGRTTAMIALRFAEVPRAQGRVLARLDHQPAQGVRE